MTHTLTIDGMSCAHCVNTVEAALRAVPGVVKVEVTLGRATVETQSTTSRDALITALAHADYPAH